MISDLFAHHHLMEQARLELNLWFPEELQHAPVWLTYLRLEIETYATFFWAHLAPDGAILYHLRISERASFPAMMQDGPVNTVAFQRVAWPGPFPQYFALRPEQVPFRFKQEVDAEPSCSWKAFEPHFHAPMGRPMGRPQVAVVTREGLQEVGDWLQRMPWESLLLEDTTV